MSDLRIELCPETGICSVVKHGACKIDLMPNEVEAIRAAGGDVAAIKAVVAECDSAFAGALAAGDVEAIVGKLS